MSEIQSNQDDKEFFFGEIHIDQLDSVSQSPWKVDIQVNDQVVNFKLGSGADVSVLPASVYDSLNAKETNESEHRNLLMFRALNISSQSLQIFARPLRGSVTLK